MPTIQEIYEQPSLKPLDGWDIAQCLYEIAAESDNQSGVFFTDPTDKYSGNSVTGERKVNVNYDCERGAVTDVLLYNGKPFAVVSRAGRGCSDTTSTYVTSHEIAEKVIMEMIGFSVPERNPSEQVELEYWEGIPVKLGQNGWAEE